MTEAYLEDDKCSEASAVGSVTNPTKLANTFGSNGMNVGGKTIGVYIEYFISNLLWVDWSF